jgi:hypothetical protein
MEVNKPYFAVKRFTSILSTVAPFYLYILNILKTLLIVCAYVAATVSLPVAAQSTATSTSQNVGNSPSKSAPKTTKSISKLAPLALAGMSSGEIPTGCGCSFYQPTNLKEAGPLQLRFNTEGKAAIKPGGALTMMRVVEEKHVRKSPKTVSAKDKMLMKFKALEGDTSASLVSTVERNCQKANNNAEQCVKVTYQSLLTLSTNGETRSYPLWGSCACGPK